MNYFVPLVLAISCTIIVRVDAELAKQSFDEQLLMDLISQNTKLTERVFKVESDLLSLKWILQSQKESEADGKGTKEKQLLDAEHKTDTTRAKRQEDGHIAFSAYKAHEVVSMGKDQTVQFQNVIINDGNGYNKYTGVFTVPRAGVYQLTFFVEDYHKFQSIFHMVVNRNIVTSAIADPIPGGQNVQGGNIVIIRLKAGDSVWVSAAVAGANIEGYGGLRTSTFSGYFLYA